MTHEDPLHRTPIHPARRPTRSKPKDNTTMYTMFNTIIEATGSQRAGTTGSGE